MESSNMSEAATQASTKGSIKTLTIEELLDLNTRDQQALNNNINTENFQNKNSTLGGNTHSHQTDSYNSNVASSTVNSLNEKKN
jgi:hypothetical protein